MGLIKKLREFVRLQPDVFRFLVLGFGGYIVWHLAYETYLKPATLLDECITQNLIVVSEAVVEALRVLDLAELAKLLPQLKITGPKFAEGSVPMTPTLPPAQALRWVHAGVPISTAPPGSHKTFSKLLTLTRPSGPTSMASLMHPACRGNSLP